MEDDPKNEDDLKNEDNLKMIIQDRTRPARAYTALVVLVLK